MLSRSSGTRECARHDAGRRGPLARAAKVVWSVVVGVLIGGAVDVTAVADERPPFNVLLLLADDFRPELGCYGSVARTPHLDALADRGIRFQRAYCQQAVCNPSRSSFLTGRRPDTLHVWSNSRHFRESQPDVVTLPQWFLQHGYETRGIGKIFHNWHTAVHGDRRSWSADEFLHYANHGDDVPLVDGTLPPNRALGIGRLYGRVPVTECRAVPDEAYYDGRVAAEAVRTLATLRNQPFFLAVGFWKPHAPFNAPQPYWDLYDRSQLPPLLAERPSGTPAIAFHDSREILGIPPNQVTPTAEQQAEMRHGYFANISYLDAQIGKVLQALDQHPQRDRTLVVFLADHGYHIGEYALWGKTSCFERDAHVPLIVAPPRLARPGRVAADLVELVDLFPTVTALAGLPTPQGLDGVSFASLVNDERPGTKRAAFTQHPRPAYFDRTERGVPEAMGYSVRTASARYTEWRDWTTGRVVGREYYEDGGDPQAPRNQYDEREQSAALAAARQALHAQFPPHIPPANR